MEATFPIRTWQLFWYICIFIVGVSGNSIVLIVISRSKDLLRSSSFNIFLFSLAVTDLLISAIGVPSYILSTHIFDHPTGSNGDVMCKLVTGYLCPFWFLTISVCLLVVICLERRRVILDPLSTMNERPLIMNSLIVFFCVVYSLIVEIPTIVGLEYAQYNNTVGQFCKYNYNAVTGRVLYVVVFSAEYLIPLLIFLISFKQVRDYLRKTEKDMNPFITAYKEEKTRVRKTALKRKSASIETMKLVVIAFFVCITPNDALYMLFQFAGISSLTWNSTIYQVCLLLRFSNSCVNPILYGFHSKRFRKHFRQVFYRRRSKDVDMGGKDKNFKYDRLANFADSFVL